MRNTIYNKTSTLFLSHNMSAADNNSLASLNDLDDESEYEEETPASTRNKACPGLPKKKRQRLLRAIDKLGGLSKCNKTDKGLLTICERFPKHFGKSGTPQRKAVSNLVGKWHGRVRKGTFDEVRKELEVPKPEGTSDFVELCDQESVSPSVAPSAIARPKTRKQKEPKASPPETITTQPSDMSSIVSPSKFRMRKPDGASHACLSSCCC